MNAELKPITNATIIFSNNKGIADTFDQGNKDGLYFMSPPTPGIYKIVVTSPGYEKQIQHCIVYHQAVFKKKIVMGKPGSIYLPVHGLFPLTSPTENVSLMIKKSYKDQEELQLIYIAAQKEIDSLRMIYSDSATPFNRYNNCISWPQDSIKRKALKKAIEESDILKTHTLHYAGGCGYIPGAMISFGYFWVSLDADEKTIRSVFSKYGFVINQMMPGGGSSSYPIYWNISATYLPPLSLDYLWDIKKINDELPLVGVNIDGMVGSETD